MGRAEENLIWTLMVRLPNYLAGAASIGAAWLMNDWEWILMFFPAWLIISQVIGGFQFKKLKSTGELRER